MVSAYSTANRNNLTNFFTVFFFGVFIEPIWKHFKPKQNIEKSHEKFENYGSSV